MRVALRMLVLGSLLASQACNGSSGSSSPLCDLESNCLIDGACVSAGTPEPGIACRACIPAASTGAWSDDDGKVCDDDLYCTTGDACHAGACTGVSRDCVDGLTCTTDACDEAAKTCTHAVAAGSCAIDGACVSAGARDPANTCRACIPAASTVAWSDDDGATCDDGLYCTTADACAAGACTGVARSCTDGLACTADACDEAARECTHPLAAGSCFIDGACVAESQPNPAARCEACVPSVSAVAYSPVVPVLTVAAGDTLACTDQTLGGAGCLVIAGTVQVIGSCRLEATLAEITGSVIADGTGYAGGTGPGVGNRGGGGSHGGIGGATFLLASGGGPMQDRSATLTLERGSGGSQYGTDAGAGGGKIEIVAGAARIEGTLSADGHAASSGGSYAAGGGAGGGISVDASGFLWLGSSAVVSARGGSGGTADLGGGGGGGGRIKLRYPSGVVEDTALLSVAGGAGGGGYQGGVAGAPGTIFDSRRSPVLGSAPDQLFYGDVAQLDGSGLGASPGEVRFNGTDAAVSAWTDTQAIVIVPAGVDGGHLLAVRDGLASNDLPYSVLNPFIDSLTKPPGSACYSGVLCLGDTFTLTGRQFGADAGSVVVTSPNSPEVAVDTILSWSDTSVEARVPCISAAMMNGVAVVAEGHESRSYTITVVPPRTVSLWPPAGPGLTVIKVNLDGMANPDGISSLVATVDGVPVPATVDWSRFQVSLTIPEGATGALAVEVLLDGCRTCQQQPSACTFWRQ